MLAPIGYHARYGTVTLDLDFTPDYEYTHVCMATRVCARWLKTLYDLFRGKIRGMVPSMKAFRNICLALSCIILAVARARALHLRAGKKGPAAATCRCRSPR